MNETSRQIIEQRNRIRGLTNKVELSYPTGKVIVNVTEVWSNISEGVHVARCSLDNNICTVLNIVFEKGGFIGEHSHDDNEKTMFVIDGSIYDHVNDKMIVEGEVYKIAKGQPHGFKSDYALCTVTFKPPFKRETNAKASN